MKAAYQDYEFNGLEAAAVRIAAQSLDDVETARAAGDTKAAHRAQRQFLQALQRLGLPQFERTT